MAYRNVTARGAGNAAERVLTTENGTINVATGQVFRVYDITGYAVGATIVRIRTATLTGAILYAFDHTAAGNFGWSPRTPIELPGGTAAAGTNYVVTEEGANANVTTLSGDERA